MIKQFIWSGGNTNKARQLAGEELTTILITSAREHPGIPHFLIAHSHGGNVALYALRDPIVRAAISGLVTLATPFIQVQARRTSDWAISAFQALCLIGAYSLPGLAIASVILNHYGRINDDLSLWMFIGGMGLFLLVRILLGILKKNILEIFVGLYKEKLFTPLQYVQTKMVESIKPSSCPTNTFIGITKGDEPLAFLGIIGRIVSVPFKIIEGFSKAYPVIIEKLMKGIRLFLWFAQFFGFFFPALSAWLMQSSTNVAMTGFALMIGISILLLILVISPLFIYPLQRLGFWGEKLMELFLVNVFVRKTPPEYQGNNVGEYNVASSSKKGIVSRFLSLNHSLIYDDRQVINDILSFIREGTINERSKMQRLYYRNIFAEYMLQHGQKSLMRDQENTKGVENK